MKTDVAIIGGGPGGATTALLLARSGISATVIEKSDFPRFHVGESLTGGVGALVRSLGLADEMNRAGHPVKHGVHVWGPKGNNEFFVPVVDVLPDGQRQQTTTWQVRRSEFDSMLLDAALDAGAQHLSGTATAPVVTDDGWVQGVDVETADGPLRVDADVVVDASGQQCFLARHGVSSEKVRGDYSAQMAVFAHVHRANRGEAGDNTVILYKESNHWAWFIPIDAETVSVGVVIPTAYYRSQRLSPTDFLEQEFRELNPELEWRLRDAEIVNEPTLIANYSYDVEQFVGPGWLCVGDSHQFVDPVFSFGVHFSMYEAQRAAAVIADHLSTDERRRDAFDDYQRWATAGQNNIRDLIDAFWGEPFAFAYLAHQKHPDDIIDLFAGRVYDLDEPSDGLRALRRITAQVREARDAERVVVAV